MSNPVSTVVDLITLKLKSQGSYPATGTGSQAWARLVNEDN
jgi:hypothetical protein